jgi:predicted glycosyltransferase
MNDEVRTNRLHFIVHRSYFIVSTSYFLHMRIWIDLANSPHVPFFGALAKEFVTRGHEVDWTAREFAQTVEMARAAGLTPEVIGGHGGRELSGKAGNLIGRAYKLMRWARGRRFDLAVSHNSYSQIVAARALRLRSVTLMDYEHQPANHVAFRLASRVVVPRAFPEDALGRFGARARKVRRYDGIKEDVYLADYRPDPRAVDEMRRALEVGDDETLVVVRPPARDALYHRFDNDLFDALLARLSSTENVRAVFLARSETQRAEFAARLSREKFILPRTALDGRLLVSAADLVVSAGGTMNREAAALSTPAATIYAGAWAAIDELLVRQGRLLRLSTRADIDTLPLERKREQAARRAAGVRAQVADLILEDW